MLNYKINLTLKCMLQNGQTHFRNLTLEIYCMLYEKVNHLSANPAEWSNTLKQFVGKLPTNWLRVFDDFVGLMFTGLRVKDFPFFPQEHKLISRTSNFI